MQRTLCPCFVNFNKNRCRDVRSKCHTRHLACEIRDPQGKNRGHENVKERCTVRLLVYYIFYDKKGV
jgi:hypothetical protein